MKNVTFLILLLFSLVSYAQDDRIQQLQYKLDALAPEVPGLSQKVNIKIRETSLSSFLVAVSEVHQVNISVDPALNNISIINNFSDVEVGDLLIFLCKEYDLKIDFTGNIIAIKKIEKVIEKPLVKDIDILYKYDSNHISINVKEDKLYDVFKKITDTSGKNLVFTPGLESKLLTSYIKDTPFDDALNKLAFSNGLIVSKTKDNFYQFEPDDDNYSSPSSGSRANTDAPRPSKPLRSRRSNFFFEVLDTDRKMLEVDFENTPVSSIIYDIGAELGIDMFISSPLESTGTATVRAKNISFDDLLNKIFEAKNTTSAINRTPSLQGGPVTNISENNTASPASNDTYTFYRRNNIYYFGLKSQLTVRQFKTIPLMYRSVEIMSDPSRGGRSAGRTSNPYVNNLGTQGTVKNDNMTSQDGNDTAARSEGTLLDIIPNEVKNGLDIRIDTEMNSFIVSGPAEHIARFESFLTYIDKEVPVVLIEVMILDVKRSATVETGISAGIGQKPAVTGGNVFPNSDITLGAGTINNIINHFDGFGSLNIGNVVPNFYLSLKALETNGNINVRSTPRLSTLSGHRAHLSIGETTYYVVTNQNYYGSQIPQASEIKNYQPIDAELSLSIKPLVSGSGEITMDIKVIQSSFNGQKVDKDAPPGINSREFTSIIRVKDQDIIVLGGLEEKSKNDSGSGTPLLSRIPVIKWLFSSRRRADSKGKLSILIKPTVFY